MKILFLGDSITEGAGASAPENNYVNKVGQKLNCEVVNYGVGGTRIGRQKAVNGKTIWNYDFRLRLEIMQDEADRVFVFGGTNDFGHGALHLGEVESRGEDTFCGSFRLLIDALCEKYCKEKLCFIIPMHRFEETAQKCKGENGDELGAALPEYVDAMRKILSEYEIEFIDLYENGIPKPLVKTGDGYTVDGLHPNDKGHELIADIICEYVGNKLKK